MRKYIVRVGDSYVTEYDSLTVNKSCAAKFKEESDADAVAEEHNGTVEEVDD